MKKSNKLKTKTLNKNKHESGCACSICGSNYKSFTFKNGFICESCLEYIKDSPVPDNKSIR